MTASTDIVEPAPEIERRRVERTFGRVAIVSRDPSARSRLSAAAEELASGETASLEIAGVGSSERARTKAIARRVEDWNADLVALTVDDARIATARLLARGSAVLAVPPAWRPPVGLSRVAVGYDGSESADAAMEGVRALVAACRGSPRVEVVHVDDCASAAAELDADVVCSRRAVVIEWWLARVAQAIPAPVGVAQHTGDPVAVLRDVSSDVDLLVVGAHGHGALQRLLGRSVAKQLIETTRCPLLIVPRSRRPRSESADGELGFTRLDSRRHSPGRAPPAGPPRRPDRRTRTRAALS